VSALVACLAALAPLAVSPVASGAGPALRSSAGKVPADFFGIVPQGSLSNADFELMKGVVGTLRLPVYWAECEPEQGRYDFTALDAIVASAAQRGMRVMPYVYGTPSWLTSVPARPPLSGTASRAWARFLQVLVGRYGQGGSFWAARTGPRLPIRSWQIWNEPNFVLFWKPKPSPRAYARLLAGSSRAIRSVDRSARIVAAGLAPVGAGLTPWDFLYGLYQVPGAKRDFDVVAIHPYASTLQRMTAQVKVARAVMRNAGDAAKPLILSELGVASGGQRSVFVKGLTGQATFLRQSFSLLLRERHRWHIAGIDWFSWRDSVNPNPYCSFCQGAGLFDVEGNAKPAWAAYRRAVSTAVR
jgi:hypothetical protein